MLTLPWMMRNTTVTVCCILIYIAMIKYFFTKRRLNSCMEDQS